VLIDGRRLRRLVDALSAGPFLAVAPTPRYRFTGSRWPVIGHYRIWTALQASSTAVSGTGAIVMSVHGRRRFAEWPDVIGDDYFANGLFAEDERARVHEVEVVVDLPTRLRDCLSRRARVHQGNRDVERAGLRRIGARGGRGRSLLELVRSRPGFAVDVPAYVIVTVGSRLVGVARRLRGSQQHFHRGRGPGTPASVSGGPDAADC
jgi:hypothetical protein